MRTAIIPAILGLTLILAGVPHGTAAVPRGGSRGWKQAAIIAGHKVIERHQCSKCHEIAGEREWPRDLSCRNCHAFVQSTKGKPDEIAKQKALYPDWEMYIENVKHYLTVPNLSKIGARIKPRFTEKYLAQPFDLRPALEESMIRNKLTQEEIRAVVRYFAAQADAPDPYPAGAGVAAAGAPLPPVNDKLVAQGEALFAKKGCASCHLFGNRDFGAMVNADFLKTMGKYAALAPDLRFARDRIRPEILVDWIIDPRKIDPNSPMPPSTVTRAEAEALAQFVLFGKPAPFVPVPRPPPPTRPTGVTYEMLDAAIFSKICLHCHEGDGETDNGAGNGGGLGYAGKGFSFDSLESFKRGSKTADGTYASVLRRGKSGKPVLLERLELRVSENRRDYIKPFEQVQDHTLVPYPGAGPGMPLGLPALSPEKIDMIRAWIAEGARTSDGTSLLPPSR